MTWQEFILSALFDIACVEVDALVVRGDILLRFECAGVDVGVVDIVLWLGSRVWWKAVILLILPGIFSRIFPAQ